MNIIREYEYDFWLYNIFIIFRQLKNFIVHSNQFLGFNCFPWVYQVSNPVDWK